MTYSISDLCRMLNIPASTIRYYDNNGLLPFMKRSESGDRYIDAADVTTFSLILNMKRAGFSLKEIRDAVNLRQLIKEEPQNEPELLGGISAIADRHIDELILEQEALTQKLRLTRFLLWYYKTAQAAGSLFVFTGDNVPEYPGPMPDLDVSVQDEESLEEMMQSYREKYTVPGK